MDALPKILKNLNIPQLNEVQESALKAGAQNDFVLLAPTGSGKTLGFLLPVLQRLSASEAGVQALVLVPTRELALQIEQVLRQMGTGYKVNCCYGGHSTYQEKKNLAHAPAVLIGTPGRVLYHLENENLDPSSIQTLVLDEFDKSLEMGFQEEMAAILKQLPRVERRFLTSATNLIEIPAFTGIQKPTVLDFLQEESMAPDLQLKVVQIEAGDKLNTLFKLLCAIGPKTTLVFCNQREAVEKVSEYLKEKGMASSIFHGGLEQPDRERAIMKFRNGTNYLLISTDLAARGLDIPEIEAVVHFQLPDAATFTHRNGRTARMKAQGSSYLLLHPDEKPAYLPSLPRPEKLPAKAQLPAPSLWETLYLSAGKKDKVSKGDIAGLLMQKGGLEKAEVGLIEIQDSASFAAVHRFKIKKAVELLKQEKLKGKKVKVEKAN
jgi:superfamily II DNA/RNA helicase